MSKQQFPNKILWLASYPKSGNTWFRAFLSALMNDGEIEINKMKTNGIFSSREIFDFVTDTNSRDMYDEEAKLMIADVFRHVAAEKDELSIIKVHDSFGHDTEGKNIIPEDVTQCAVYFIRNPLDIAGSLANHNHSSVEEAVKMLNDKEACLSKQMNNLNRHNQFRQYLSDWSSHVNSWLSCPAFPVHVVRYEDILKAIDATSFDKLSRQETEKGFTEKNVKSEKFFRSGTMRNWEKELSNDQINKIIAMHKATMGSYGYSL
jgi:hypothetical protein